MAQRVKALAAALVMATAGCGPSQPAVTVPAPTSPLPTAGIAGQEVTVYPLTLIAAEESLGWTDRLSRRREVLDRADSLFAVLLAERSPEVTWIFPADLRRAARRAPGMLVDPDQMGTALLRHENITQLPDPLRSQMRSLNGVAGGRFALVPAGVVFKATADGRGEAELSLLIADVRTGLIGWRTVARATGDDPWSALRDAIKTLTPGLP